MPTNVRIPTPLRQLTGGEELVTVTAANVGAAIAEMQAKYPGIKDRLLDDKGEVRRFVNVYVNERSEGAHV